MLRFFFLSEVFHRQGIELKWNCSSLNNQHPHLEFMLLAVYIILEEECAWLPLIKELLNREV